MTAIEAVVTRVDGARELGAGMMSLGLLLSPWRCIGAASTERSTLAVEIVMDLDLADAWLRNLDPGACVRMTCASELPPTGSIGTFVDLRGDELDVQPRPLGWPRAPDGRVTVGDRVRITAGDSIHELGTVRAMAEGRSQLYTIVLDDEAAILQTIAGRFDAVT